VGLGYIPIFEIGNESEEATRVFLLSHSEDRMILSSFVWVQYQRVTDGRTDGRTDGIAVAITALCIASNAVAL